MRFLMYTKLDTRTKRRKYQLIYGRMTPYHISMRASHYISLNAILQEPYKNIKNPNKGGFLSWLKIPVLKLIENCNFVGLNYYTVRFGFSLFWHFSTSLSNFSNYFKRITDEGSVPEMRICSCYYNEIKSDLKWCIHLSRSLYLYSQCKH